MSDYFPPLDLKTLKELVLVKKLHEQDPTYLHRSGYPAEVGMLFPPTEAVKVEKPKTKGSDLDLVQELTETYKELLDHKPPKEDSAAAMAYYRTRTKLLSDLLAEISKGQNAKQISEFYNMVLKFMEENFTPDQINEFREFLKS